VRRFEVLDEMQREAEDRFRAQEEKLISRIGEIQAQIADLRQKGDEGTALLTAEEQRAIDAFRNDLLDLRQELREVQFALDQDVKRLKFYLKALNIWAVPLLVAMVAILLAAMRRRRSHRYRVSVEG
ncbi:MAG: ABC transporter, partial [Kiloniellales bacterium]|nr:ABC transporter [Kiloniellales bacterium]